MANRYWVGGTASWDGTAGTKWAATSGGAGGQSVPTSADDVFFDAASGVSTVTIATGNTGAKSITCTGFTGTLTGTAAITVSGSVTLVAGMTYSHTGVMTFDGTGTLITAGKTFSGITVNGSGITLTLGDALNTGVNTLTVTTGTFNTANFSVNTNRISSATTNPRTITLGSSTITLPTAGTQVDFSIGTNLTFNAGTSQINLSNAGGGTINASGQTFYNVSFTATAVAGISHSITGDNTFNNLSITPPSSSGMVTLQVIGNQTINGTLTCAGATSLRRVFVRSNTLGTTRTLTVATLSATDCDFRDITLAGAASPASPTRAGDCGGNSGITFPAAKTVYRVGTNTTWSGSSSWATSSGGAGADTNFPLAQDTAVIDNNTTLTGTLSLATYNFSAVDASTRTTAITLNHNTNVIRYGSYTLGSGVTVTGTFTQTFSGRGTMNLTTAGKTLTFLFQIDAFTGTLRLLDAATSSSSSFLTSGTLNLNGFNLTTTTFTSSNSNTRTLAFGSGSISVTSTGTVFDTGTTTGLTVTGTPVVNVTNATATATTVTPGSPTEANSISFNFTAGTYALTLSSGSVRSLNFTGFAGTLSNLTRTIYGDIVFSTGMSITAGTLALTFASTSGTARNITTNGKTLDFPINFDGLGGTWKLLSALTLGSTRTLTHANGTLDLNGFTLSSGTSYTTATGTKDLTFNGGTLTCPSSGTSFNNAAPTGFTTTAGTGTGTINMTSSSGAKTFVGGGSTYNCTLNNGGTSALTITDSNTFTTIANSVQPTTFSFTAGTTTTLTNWNISGTAGNLVTIQSATASSHTLSKASGTVNANYLSISRSTATGGATWNAGVNSVDGGNNTGWIFPSPPSGGKFLLLF
jgi:hypothetical protein